jgi:hypothetical protein
VIVHEHDELVHLAPEPPPRLASAIGAGQAPFIGARIRRRKIGCRFWGRGFGYEVASQGTFSRQLFLGDNLDAGRLEASFDQGILTLTVPVAEQAKPRRIQVGAQSKGPQQVEAASSESG